MEATSIGRKIKTLHFGELTVESNHIFYFPNGVLGFEDLKEYALVSDEDTQPFKWLISMDEPVIGFPLLSPWIIDLNYKPGRDIDPERKVVFCIVTLRDDQGMTANLKAPIVLDIESHSGEQIILPSDKYSPSHVVVGKN